MRVSDPLLPLTKQHLAVRHSVALTVVLPSLPWPGPSSGYRDGIISLSATLPLWSSGFSMIGEHGTEPAAGYPSGPAVAVAQLGR